MEDHPTAETSNDPATTEAAEPKQRKLRAENHEELLMGLANQSSTGDAAEPVELELWDRATVLKFFGGTKPIHISTLYRGVHSGLYPPPMNVSPNVVRWIGSECRAAQQRMLSQRAKPKPPPPPARRGRPPGRRRKAATATEAETA